MLHLHNISKIYRLDHSEIHALQGIALEIKEGEFVALVGPSGSGKSTLLHIIGGLDKPTSGAVYFNNKNLGDMDDGELSQFRNLHVGFVFQDPLLLPHLTVMENVALPVMFSEMKVENGEKIENILKAVGLENRAHHKPSELSGGQKQRAVIARALVMQPALILADEPTGNLDTKTGREILELFKRLHAERNITFIIATHDAEIAKSAKRIFEIRDGRIS